MDVARRSRWLTLGGGLLLVAGVAHAFGFAQFDAGLAGVDPATRAGLHAGWLWGSATFLALGAVVLGAARRWSRGVDPRPAVLPAAGALLLFGGVGFVARGLDPHYLGFVALGTLLAGPVVGLRRGGA